MFFRYYMLFLLSQTITSGKILLTPRYKPKYQPTSTSIWYINTDTGQAASIKTVYNSNAKVAMLLDRLDLPMAKAVNLFELFCQLQGMIPRLCSNGAARSNGYLPPTSGIGDLLSCIIVAGEMYSHEDDPRKCNYVDLLHFAIDLTDKLLKQQREEMEAKLATRAESLLRKHRNAIRKLLESAIFQGNFAAMVKASGEVGISLDH
jgi:hypothetical protein